MTIRPFHPDDETAVIELWRRCDLLRPWNDPHLDVQRKLRQNDGLFLVGEIDGKIIASVMAGWDGHRGWLYLVGVDPDHQRRGHARAIVTEMEKILHAHGCRKINLQVRDTNQHVIEFYQRLGYSIDPVRSMGKRFPTSPTTPAE